MLHCKTRLWIGGFLLLLLVAGSIIVLTQRHSSAPDITFQYIDGRQIRLKHLKNRPVLVTFWATTCSACMKEMPHLITLYNSLSTQGLEIVGVAMSYDRPDQVLTLAKDRNVPYSISLDIDGTIARAFGDITVTPTTFLIGTDGRIIARTDGPLDMEKLRRQISDLLIQAQVNGHKLQATLKKTKVI